MDTDLAQKAINEALKGDWKEATKTNLQILKTNPQDIDALNRLARAYAEKGEFGKAKKSAEKVIKIDPFNPIATKALNRWKVAKRGKMENGAGTGAEVFLEETGKTKQISLLHLGDAKLLAKLNAGDRVRLTPHAHRVSVLTHDDKYIGRLPDDLAARLRKLIKIGNQYEVFIKSTDSNDVKVFIRETYRSAELASIPSFPAEKIEYVSFTPPELVRKNEESPITTFEEE